MYSKKDIKSVAKHSFCEHNTSMKRYNMARFILKRNQHPPPKAEGAIEHWRIDGRTNWLIRAEQRRGNTARMEGSERI